MPKRSRGAAPRAAGNEPSPKARRSEGTSAMRLETALSKADDASEAFFELANAASIAVAVPGDLDIDGSIASALLECAAAPECSLYCVSTH